MKRPLLLSLIPRLAVALLALAGGLGSVRAGWQLVWSDEFDTSTVDTTKWVFEIGNNGGWGNSEREYYTSRTNNAYVGGGLLHIVARKESTNGFPYTSARMKTQGLFSKLYGRIEFRAKLPLGLGYWPALWMMGTNITSVGWPACGEIDVMEFNGSWSNQVQGTIHYSDSANNHLQQTFMRTNSGAGGSVTNFHTYALDWSTNSILWLVDGVRVKEWTSWSSSTGPYPAPFNKPFFLLMNLAVGGSYLGYPSDATIDANTVFPGEMQVDYVRVYEYVASIPEAPTGFTATAGNGKIHLNWDAPVGATGYNLKRATATGGPYTTIASPATNGYTDTAVSSCSSYFYVVSATNSLGESTNSSEQSATLGAFALAVNSGGTAAAQFIADTYFSGGTSATTGNAIDTSAVTNPAPQSVYQSERYGSCTYTFTGLTPGLNYDVRLHFAEFYWDAVGQRRFNVFLNGTQVLTNFDILAVAGAKNKATVREFNAAANGSGQIVIQYTTVTDNAKSSGIEILLPRTAAPTGLAAIGGNSQVALSWNPVVGATYNVKRSLIDGGPYASVFGGLTATNCTDSGLTNGTAYYYVVSATLAGCESADSAQASATPFCTPPPAPTAGNNSPICAGSTLNLIASTVPGATYSWTGPGGFTSSLQNPSFPNATTDASGLYSVTATLNGCTSSPGTTTVTVNPVPAAPTAGNNGPIWAGMTLNLTASSVPGATYTWTGPNGFASTEQNPSITSASTNASGLYSVVVATGGCASAPGTTTVTVNPPAVVTLQRLSGDVILSWPGGTLQTATNVIGPWDTLSGATSPRTNPATAPQEFYRLRLP